MSRAPSKAAERRQQALALRLAGVPHPEIARRLGFPSATAAATAATHALRDGTAAADGAGESLLDLQRARYERVVTAHWQDSMRGKGWHTDRVLAALARIDKIAGLEQTRVEVTTGDLSARVLDLVDRVLGQETPADPSASSAPAPSAP